MGNINNVSLFDQINYEIENHLDDYLTTSTRVHVLDQNQNLFAGWDCGYCGRYNVSFEKNCEGCGSAYHRPVKKRSN
jgi:hypothetical protein